MIMTQAEQWVPLTEAAKEIGVSAAKLSRMAKDGRVSTRKDPYDERKTLVNLVELRSIFPPRR
jgi:DNA-binding MarR family transcriptional regulator